MKRETRGKRAYRSPGAFDTTHKQRARVCDELLDLGMDPFNVRRVAAGVLAQR